MSFNIVMEKLADERFVTPILIAWQRLVRSHKEGFITYTVKNKAYNIDASHYSRKAKEWEKKRDELQKYCSEEITLNDMPMSPTEIGKKLSHTIRDRSPDEIKDIFNALGYGKITGLNEDDKMIFSLTDFHFERK